MSAFLAFLLPPYAASFVFFTAGPRAAYTPTYTLFIYAESALTIRRRRRRCRLSFNLWRDDEFLRISRELFECRTRTSARILYIASAHIKRARRSEFFLFLKFLSLNARDSTRGGDQVAGARCHILASLKAPRLETLKE